MALAHEKVGHTEQGLWHHKGMQLPAFIQHLANDLIADGHPTSQAIQMAIGICQRWARGGGDVKPETQAKAATAIAEWEALKAKAHASTEKEHHGRIGKVTAYTRSFPLEDISIRSGGDGRTVDAYATVFDEEAEIRDEDGHYKEVNDRTMYNRAIADAAPAGGRQSWRVGVFYNHGMTIWKTPSDLYSMPCGVPVEIRPEKRGLFTRTRYVAGQLGDQILDGIREGLLTTYSVSGRYLRSDPPIPRMGFRPAHDGKLQVVRRMEATLREYGPTPVPAFAGAEIIGVRAEQVASLLGTLDPDERERLALMLRAGAPLDSPDADAPEESGLVAEDSRPRGGEMRSGRPLTPREELQAQRAKFLVKHGGGRIGA
jgi:phage head maturation protease